MKWGAAYWPEILVGENSLSGVGPYGVLCRTDTFSGGYGIGDAAEALNTSFELDELRRDVAEK